MKDERERCLELFGLKPGASAQEIKAAYRDLAKVWHPDRFSHDPRLQEKAQNKLKEINEVYEALTSGNFNRRPQAATEPTTAYAPPPRSQHTESKYLWPMLLILLACVVMAALFIYPRLSRERERSEKAQASVSSQPVKDEESERDDAANNRREKKSVEKQKAPVVDSTSEPVKANAPLRPLPTVTVTIDPTTGMLARADCPVKNSMTYPGGQEPHQYCSADHHTVAETKTPPNSEKKSRLKSLGNRLADSARWLKDKTQ